jgi:response regulator RpfG family c-di-GMP phosphodiesterase
MYKEAFTHETARTMIIENSGRHFDPDVVQAFIVSEADFLAIRQRYSNEAPTSNTAADGNPPKSPVRIG